MNSYSFPCPIDRVPRWMKDYQSRYAGDPDALHTMTKEALRKELQRRKRQTTEPEYVPQQHYKGPRMVAGRRLIPMPLKVPAEQTYYPTAEDIRTQRFRPMRPIRSPYNPFVPQNSGAYAEEIETEGETEAVDEEEEEEEEDEDDDTGMSELGDTDVEDDGSLVSSESDQNPSWGWQYYTRGAPRYTSPPRPPPMSPNPRAPQPPRARSPRAYFSAGDYPSYVDANSLRETRRLF